LKDYHKIQTVFQRDPLTKFKTLLIGKFSLPEFAFLADCRWVFTEKVDGTNTRIMWDGERIRFGGRTANAQIPVHLATALDDMFHGRDALFHELFTGGDICLFGEGYGPKIQKVGKLYREDHSFVLFDVRCGEVWLRREDVEKVAAALGIDVVPIIGYGTLQQMVDFARSGIVSTWGEFDAEGIVARPESEMRTRLGQRIITKIKCKDFPT
jgi:hypothetical protein